MIFNLNQKFKKKESYYEIMEQHPKYKIWHNLGLTFDSKVNKEKTREYYNREI